MPISPQRKAYAAVLLIAGSALAVDRGFFGVSGASPAHAAELGQPLQPTRAVAKAPSKTPATLTLAKRLKQLGDVPREVDLLEGTLQRAVEIPAKAPPQVDVGEDSRKRFALTHHVSALASKSRGSNAVVNGRAVRIGEEIDGFRLVDVTRTAAVFHGAGGTIELTLPASR